MRAFHSDTAMKMIDRLPKSKQPPTGVEPPTACTYAFRELRRRLEEEGWFQPRPRLEARNLAWWVGSLSVGVYMSRFAGRLATLGSVFFLAVANTLTGWLGHDYVHGRSRWCTAMRPFGELAAGLSTSWWSNKHNMHHALTNEVGYDEDIALEPFVFLWRPDPSKDSPSRKVQHWSWPISFSSLFFYWRIDSLRYTWKAKKWGEFGRLLAHWAFFGCLVPVRPRPRHHLPRAHEEITRAPSYTCKCYASVRPSPDQTNCARAQVKHLLLSIWLSGFMTATIVTATHQSEEIFYGDSLRKYDFVEAQFRSTRDARIVTPFSGVLWGGMQWQLEHHLFPTIPRYRYPELSKVVAAFAAEHQLEYRVTDEWKLLKQNIDLLERLAKAEPQPGNPDSTPVFKQL